MSTTNVTDGRALGRSFGPVLGCLLLLSMALPGCSDSGGTEPGNGNGNGPEPPPPSEADVTVDTTRRFQTIVGGWPAVAQACHFECPNLWPQYADELFDAAVEDLGLTSIRLEVRSGSEHPEDPAQRFLDGEISFSEWKQTWYRIVNDNGDPLTIDPAGFQFTELDATVEDVVLPVRQRLAARGEDLYVTLTYVDFGNSEFRHRDHPEEYAEFLLATVRHLEEAYSLVPDAVEIILEPDVAGWSAVPAGEALVAAAERLRDAGYDPDIVAPSHSGMSGSVSFFDDMTQVDGVLDEITDLSYHRYRGVSDQALSDIADRADDHGLRTAMLEHIGSGHEDLYEDLTVANNSSWQQFSLGEPRADLGSRQGIYIGVHPQTLEARLMELARFLSEYFRAIRLGAVRVAATSDLDRLKPVAFVNEDGRHVVVVAASEEGSFTITGLPAGTYEVGHTTADERVEVAKEVTLEANGVAEVSIPGAGVLSLRQR